MLIFHHFPENGFAFNLRQSAATWFDNIHSLPCSQKARRWRSSFRAPFNTFKSVDLEHRLASSAYIETEEVFNACGRSLMYNGNKSGPRY